MSDSQNLGMNDWLTTFFFSWFCLCYWDYGHVICDTVPSYGWLPTFWRNPLPQSSVIHFGVGNRSLREVDRYQHDYRMSQPKNDRMTQLNCFFVSDFVFGWDWRNPDRSHHVRVFFQVSSILSYKFYCKYVKSQIIWGLLKITLGVFSFRNPLFSIVIIQTCRIGCSSPYF
jgi:hypothetical protein